MRDAIHVLLETRGFQVSEYGSAQDYLREPQNDCVLLIDIAMSELGGLDLAEILRTGGVEIPIILMTDVPRPGQTQRISAAFRCTALPKPIDSGSLLAAIASSVCGTPCSHANT
ncbi:MAG: response regulator [Proteobacteria bacterium]|nr:response regulator [Pseudomonadota bacterium]